MKRIYSIIACLLLAAVLLTACSPQTQPDATAEPPAAAASDSSPAGTPVKAPDIDEATGKIRLTLASIRMGGSGWQELAEGFNAQSDSYIVELKDYYTGDESSDFSDLDQLSTDLADAKTRLHTELIAGKLPDMLAFDSLSPLPYLAKGLLLDLDPYLAADEELSAEELLCWNALHEYGGLYILGRSFYVDTLACTQEFYEAHKNWTIPEYLEVEAGLHSGQQMIYTMSPEDFLTQMGGQYLTKALDLEHAVCDFDNPEFISILNGVLAAGAYELSEEVETPAAKRVENGQLICCAVWLDAPRQVAYDRNDGGRRLAYLGWPTADGSCGSVVNLSGAISAFAETASPEGCWEFIKYAVTHDAGGMFAGFGSPLYLPLLQKSVEEWNTDPLLIPELQVTDEDMTVYLDAVNAAPAMAYRDEAVMTIMQEECAPLLRGEGTAADAAKRIQSRASLYMTEQYG